MLFQEFPMLLRKEKILLRRILIQLKEFSSETEKAIEELNMKLSEAKINSQSLINKSIQDIKEDK